MGSLERRNGWFMRDERHSGGVKLEIKAPTCCHCNRVILVLPDRTRAMFGLPLRTHPRGYCPKCDAYVCDQYACQNFCTPIWKLIDIAKRYPNLQVFARPGGQLPFDPAILAEDKVYASAGGILLPSTTRGA
jgi:hypothetical protein